MDTFRRFVETFPELLEPDEALRAWKSLHTPAPPLTAEPLRFGVRELSVSIRSQGGASLRWLAEAYSRQPFDPSTAAQARGIAHGVFDLLREQHGADLPEERFDRLFDMTYPLHDLSGARPTFRIGYALEFLEGRPPSFKWYAEPRTAGPAGTFERVTAIAGFLGLGEHWLRADAAIHRRLPAASLRGFGTDLSVKDVPNLKVYYSVRGCDWAQLLAIAEPAAQGHGLAALERFHRLVLKGRTRVPPNAILLAVVLAPFFDPGAPTLKWDVYLPQLHTGDAPVQRRLLLLCEALGLDPAAYLRLWQVVAGPEQPQDLLNVHQYASIDLAPDGEAKLNVYLRAPEHTTEHMPLRMRPGRLRAGDRNERCVRAVQRGLVALADAAESGYVEMTHSMVFPSHAGFRNGDRVLRGSVFQRAVVCRALATARLRYDVDEAALRADLDFLASQQDLASGGWKYFPELAELPPDADDVAQVLLAFLKVRDPRTQGLFARILECVERLAGPAGALPTWLVDPAADDPGSALYREAVARWWGEGSDPEVVANLGYALWRFDPDRFGTLVRAACSWLAAAQTSQGAWDSTWYWGRMYGTWQAVRLLAAVQPGDAALARAARAWTQGQGEGGGWDSELETAFGLQAGVELYKAGVLSRDALRLCPGVGWLCDRQNQDGSWSAVPWIRMDLNRAAVQRGQGRPRFLGHGSSTLTTALCVQALLEALALEADPS